MGIPLFPSPSEAKLCVCGQVPDIFDLLGCSNKMLRTKHHDALVDIVFHSVLADNSQCRREQQFSGNSEARLGDIYHPDFELGLPMYLDISVRNTMQPSYLIATASGAGMAADAGEKEKDHCYRELVESVGCGFHPLIVEMLVTSKILGDNGYAKYRSHLLPGYS